MFTLRDLYEEHSSQECIDPPEIQAIREKGFVYWDKIQETMGNKFLEELWDHEMELDAELRYRDFREGFLLGASLMLELL